MFTPSSCSEGFPNPTYRAPNGAQLGMVALDLQVTFPGSCLVKALRQRAGVGEMLSG